MSTIVSVFLSSFRQSIVCCFLAAFLILSLMAGPAQKAQALPGSTFTVTANTDEADNNLSDGMCKTNANNCSLRAAIQQTNYLPGSDTILFHENILLVTLNSPLPALADATGGTKIIGRGIPIYIFGTLAGTNVDGFTINSNNNQIQGLDIVGFTGNGIVINGDNNIIGVDGDNVNDASEGNLIRDNDKNGILVQSSAENNRISGNRFGVDRSNAAFPNLMNGIHLAGTNNRVGVLGDGVSDNLEGNYIARSGQDGIYVTNASNKIAGNTLYYNTLNGILVYACNLNVIGTNGDGISDDLEANLIHYNRQNGIKLNAAMENTIAGNKIGTNASGTEINRNEWSGIYLLASSANLIGTDGSGIGLEAEGNLISGNNSHGVQLDSSFGNTIAGNKIGTDISGALALKNFDGIFLDSSFSNTIGTDGNGVGDAFEGNLISGNGRNGIAILNEDSSANVIAGNRIGVNMNGTTALPNEEYGVYIFGGSENLVGANGLGGFAVGDAYTVGDVSAAIGAMDTSQRNLISGNLLSGVYLKGEQNRIAGNMIGMDASGSLALPNSWGIILDDAQNNFIGSNGDGIGDAVEGNLISGNYNGGILIKKSVSNTFGNKVYGNRIGVSLAGPGSLPNNGPGVLIQNVGNNTIGASAPYLGNLIMNHPGRGITFTSIGEVIGNSFRGNSIYANLLGIDLNLDGVTSNDPGDSDTGPNGLLNFPVLSGAESTGDTVSIVVALQSKGGKNYSLDFFWSPTCNSSGYGEGQLFLESKSVTTGGGGDFFGQIGLLAYWLQPGYITATATDANGSTSEFSACVFMEGGRYRTFLPVVVR